MFWIISFFFWGLLAVPPKATVQISNPHFGSVSTVSSATITIPQGTIIKLRLAERIDSRYSLVGTDVHLTIEEDVFQNDVLVFKKDTPVTGIITVSQKAKTLGRGGVLDFVVTLVPAVDGTEVPVRAAATHAAGNDSFPETAVGLVLVHPVALFATGKNAMVEAGTLFPVFVSRDVEISIPASSE